jgi:hypothetical protein
MRRAIAGVSRLTGTGWPTFRVGLEGEWCIANANPRRWPPGQAVLIQYDPADQFAEIVDPETLERI